MKQYLIAACMLICFVSPTRADSEKEAARWREAKINPHFSIALDLEVARFKQLAPRYQKISDILQGKVPASVIFCLHQRESSGNFRCHPHEGSPLTGRTRYVPKGRLPAPAQPPFTFEQSAVDAYAICDHLDRVRWSVLPDALWAIVEFNGTGYSRFHPDVPTPYLWSGTNLYRRGKYTGDGKFDRMAVDKQLGCAAIIMRMREQGINAPWDPQDYIPLPASFDFRTSY